MQTKLSRTALLGEAGAILLLSLPIIANGCLESCYGFINTLLVAHLGEAELAAAGLVSMLFFTLMVIFWGTISAVSIIISHYHGAGNKPAIRGVMRDSIVVSLILSIPIMILMWFAPDIFKWTGQSAFIVDQSKKYLHALVWAVPFDLPGFALMQLFQGISKPRINLIFTVCYIPFLVWMDYIFMFGKLGLPAMGLAGIGWGTSIAYAFFLFAMASFVYYVPYYRDYVDFKTASKESYLGEILRLGLPLGAMYSVEVGYFLVLAVFLGKISTAILSANQIVMQYFWLSMTVVFSLMQAFSIRVGWRLGRKEPEWILPIAIIGQASTLIYTLLMALVYIFLPHYLIHFDFIGAAAPHAELVSNIVLLFFFAAFFQIADGTRLTIFSILRGMKDTRFTLLTSVITFWGIALPLGYYLAFIKYDRYAPGLWIGLVISAWVGFFMLWLRLWRNIKKGVI